MTPWERFAEFLRNPANHHRQPKELRGVSANFGEFLRIRPIRPFWPANIRRISSNIQRIWANMQATKCQKTTDSANACEFLRISAGPACSRRHSANIRRMSGEYPADIRRIALDLAQSRRISANFGEFRRIPARLLGATRRRDNNSANFGEFRRMRIMMHRNPANIHWISANVCIRRIFGECSPNVHRIFAEYSLDFRRIPCRFHRIPLIVEGNSVGILSSYSTP